MSKLKDRPASDLWGMGIVVGVHALALAAPFCMTPSAIGAFLIGYLITGLGITMSYHRQLTHKSFTTPKLLEYIFAYWGASAVQGDPIEWISAHRHHHAHCDTVVDPTQSKRWILLVTHGLVF